MTRVEARAALFVALALLAGGGVWLWGPYGLLGSGFVLAILVLFVFDVKETNSDQALAEAARPGLRHPIQPRRVPR